MPFHSLPAGRIYQCFPKVLISNLIAKKAIVQELKRLGTPITYKCPIDTKYYTISVLCFTDAGGRSDGAQLSTTEGLLIRNLEEDSSFHAISWTSHKRKRPVSSVAAVEILAAGEEFNR